MIALNEFYIETAWILFVIHNAGFDPEAVLVIEYWSAGGGEIYL